MQIYSLFLLGLLFVNICCASTAELCDYVTRDDFEAVKNCLEGCSLDVINCVISAAWTFRKPKFLDLALKCVPPSALKYKDKETVYEFFRNDTDFKEVVERREKGSILYRDGVTTVTNWPGQLMKSYKYTIPPYGDLADYLVQREADLSLEYRGWNILDLLIMTGKEDSALNLINHGAKMSERISRDDEETCHFSALTYITSTPCGKWDTLMIAVGQGQVSVVRALVHKYGIPYNQATGERKTPRRIARLIEDDDKRMKIIDILEAGRLDPEFEKIIRKWNADDPSVNLHEAIMSQDLELVEACLHAKKYNNRTTLALYMKEALAYSTPQILQILHLEGFYRDFLTESQLELTRQLNEEKYDVLVPSRYYKWCVFGNEAHLTVQRRSEPLPY